MASQPVKDYVDQKPATEVTLDVFTGSRPAAFVYYDDDGNTYAYEKGQRATYDLVWHDATRTLDIGARQGSFPGMVAQRKLTIVLLASRSTASAETALASTKTVTYSGEPVEVKFPF